MARKQPIAAPMEIQTRRDQEIVTQVRKYKLITPLFGGGVEPGEADPVTVVRASEIRGHLRFWWRATRGGQFGGKLEDMKAAEDALWGSASTKEGGGPSLVQVEVEALSKPVPFKPIDRSGQPAPHVGHPRSRDSYAAFPLNDKAGEVKVDVSFQVTLRYPKQDFALAELEAALWAWETFGGIGARTRRGFGALSCTTIDDQPNTNLPAANDTNAAQAWLSNTISQHLAGSQWPTDIPHLSGQPQMRIVRGRANSVETWRYLIEQLKNFRQHRNRGQNSLFGRSRWPEADEVRRITGRSLPTHRAPISTVRKFPRAAFGLPLIIQFKRNQWAHGAQAGDPPGNNTIKGQLANGNIVERWASPLILRPLATQQGNVGLALVLESSQPNLVLETGRQHYTPVSAEVTPAERSQLLRNDNRSLLLGNAKDVMSAFLATL